MEKRASIEKAAELIRQHNRIVFFGGAGVSTESGIPDFRSVDGLYNMKYDYPPEIILSHRFFFEHTAEFFRFYRDKILITAKPNKAHSFLAFLEDQKKIAGIITQNIDGLHSDAGSKNVYELHGSIRRNHCIKCGEVYGSTKMYEEPFPVCRCGGIIKPDVVLYEEPLDNLTVRGAVQAIVNSDLMIIGGTSLAIYPAAGLIDYYRGRDIILINKSKTPADYMASVVINEAIGKVFGEIERIVYPIQNNE